MDKKLEELIEENETLKKKVKKLKKDMLMSKMEYETEIEYSLRRQYLLNLLIPRTDMEDMTRILFAYMIRMLPFRKANLLIKKQGYEYNAEINVEEDQIFLKEIDKTCPKLQTLIDKAISERKGFLLCSIRDYDKKLYQDCETCMIYPISFGENSYSIVYFENDLQGSYSEREFEIVEEILQDVAYPILSAVEFAKAITSSKLRIKDEKTGLYNQLYLLSVLEKQLLISKATRQPFSIININVLDENPEIRERVLKKVAFYFKEMVRKIDTVFRSGEHELVILINNAAEGVAENVLKRLENSHEILAEINEDKIDLQFGIYTHQGEILETNLEVLEKAKKLKL